MNVKDSISVSMDTVKGKEKQTNLPKIYFRINPLWVIS